MDACLSHVIIPTAIPYVTWQMENIKLKVMNYILHAQLNIFIDKAGLTDGNSQKNSSFGDKGSCSSSASSSHSFC